MSNLSKFTARTMVQGDVALLADGTTAGAKSDTQKLQVPADGVHINVAGTFKFVDTAGNTNAITVNAGQSSAYAISQVLSTGTTLANTEFSLFRGP